MSKADTKRQDAKQAHRRLQKAREEPEQRVEELTAEQQRLNQQLRGEIERRAQAEEFLKEFLRFEQLLSDLSARFVSLPADQIDEEIQRALKEVREFFDVDRCGFLAVSSDRQVVRVAYASYAEGIEHVPADIDLAKLFPWSYVRLIKEGQHISFSRVEDLPDAAQQDRQNYAAMGIRSFMDIPLYVGESIPFVIVLSATRQPRIWPEEFIPRLRLLGEIFANALERRHADRMLQESEARLRDITFNMADWVWEVDEHGVYTYSSRKGLDLLGRSREEVIGKTPFDFMPPEEAKRVAAIFSEIAANKAPIKDLENWNIGKNGERLCLLTNGVPILDEEGNLKGYRGVDKDITERKRTEEELQASEEKFREFFKNTPDYCYIISTGGNILHINEAALKTLGYKREELVGQPLARIYAPESLAKMQDLFTQWNKSGQIRNEEMVILTKKGERRVVILNAGAVKDKDGTILHSTSVQTDITDRKRAEIEALNARRELLRLERLSRMGELAASLAHELNQPLTAILSNASAALRFLQSGKLEDGELRDILQDIVSDDKRAGGLLQASGLW